MIRFVRSLPGRFWRLVRRRPRTTLLVVFLVLVCAAGAGYGYVVWEWRQAVTAVREGRPADAREKLGRPLIVWPNSPEVHRLFARASWMTGDYPAAELHLNKCLQLEDGASEDTQLEFLLMRAQTGEVEEVSFILLEFVNRKHPDSSLIFETISLAYIRNLRYGPAYSCLNSWIKAFPNSARAHHYRGWVLERLDQPKSAMDEYVLALELDPSMDRVRLRVAEMYLEDKLPLKALPHLEHLLLRDPNRPEAKARLGQCKYMQGEHAEARRLLEGVVDKLPNDTLVLLFLARLDIDDQQPVQAETRLRQVLMIDPSDTEARFALVTSLQLQGKDAAAMAELEEYDRQKAGLDRANKLLQAEARHPSRDAQSAHEIGALLLSIRHDQQALHWLEEALSRNPNHLATHQLLADYYARKGDPQRAALHRSQLPKNTGSK